MESVGKIRLFIRTSVRMPLSARSTYLRARERECTAYYVNYWGGGGARKRLRFSRTIKEPVLNVIEDSHPNYILVVT